MNLFAPNFFMETYINKGKPHPMAQLDANEAALAKRLGVAEAPYTPPSEKFYQSNYILDGCVAADLRSGFGYYRSAARQLSSFRQNQRENGMVPGVSHPPKIFTVNPERWLSTRPFEGNDYTQSPTWAHSVLVLYDAASTKPAVSPDQAIDRDKLLRGIYPSLGRHYDYLIEHRQVASDDPRVFLLHPHEANRDSGPEYDIWKQEEMERLLGAAAILFERKPRTGEHMPAKFNRANRRNDYFGALAINLAGYRAEWDPARIRERGEFVDVWFNCLLYESYDAMSKLADRIGRDGDKQRFAGLAADLEQAIINKNYFAKARNGKGAFYSTYNGLPTYKDTVGNLITTLLPNLPTQQLRSNLDLRREGFNPNFPLPSVATFDVDNYDPYYEEDDRHWRGPSWPVANRIDMRGLNIQIDREDIPEDLRNDCWWWFHRLHQSNLGMVEVTGDYAEHNNPVTGQGQRMHRTRGHTFGVAAHMPI